LSSQISLAVCNTLMTLPDSQTSSFFSGSRMMEEHHHHASSPIGLNYKESPPGSLPSQETSVVSTPDTIILSQDEEPAMIPLTFTTNSDLKAKLRSRKLIPMMTQISAEQNAQHQQHQVPEAGGDQAGAHDVTIHKVSGADDVMFYEEEDESKAKKRRSDEVKKENCDGSYDVTKSDAKNDVNVHNFLGMTMPAFSTNRAPRIGLSRLQRTTPLHQIKK